MRGRGGEGVGDGGLEGIGVRGVGKKWMEMKEVKGWEDVRRGVWRYGRGMFNVMKEKWEVGLGDVDKIWKKVE
ncbi:hypothetical protein ACRFB9_28260 [Klebsiella pneumoniae]